MRTKLLIPLWAASPGKIFAVAAQGNAQLREQAANGVGTDGQTQLGQSGGDVTQPPVGARTTTSHGIAAQRIG